SRHVAIHRFSDMLLVEAASRKEVWSVKLQRRGPYRPDTPRLAFTPDGKHLVSARNDEGLVRVWSAKTGKEIRHFAYAVLDGGESGGAGNSLAISADGKRAIVHSPGAKKEGGLVVLDLETGKELARHRLSTGKNWVHFVATSPDDRHFAFSRADRVRMLELMT